MGRRSKLNNELETVDHNTSEYAKFKELIRSQFNMGLLPKQYLTTIENGKPVVHKEITDAKLEEALVKIDQGVKMGLSPKLALEQIANINGKMVIWGEALSALVLRSGLLVDYKQWFDNETNTAHCLMKRKGFESPMEYTFSYDDAKAANLMGKGVWASYPKRMCANRARGFLIKDLFSDVLQGVFVREEVEDYDENLDFTKVKTVKIEQLSDKLVELQEQVEKAITETELQEIYKNNCKDLSLNDKKELAKICKEKKQKILDNLIQ